MSDQAEEEDWAAALDLDSIIAAYRRSKQQQPHRNALPTPTPTPSQAHQQHSSTSPTTASAQPPHALPKPPPKSSTAPAKKRKYFARDDTSGEPALDPDDSLPADDGDAVAALEAQCGALEAYAKAHKVVVRPEVLAFLRQSSCRLFPYQARGIARILELSFRAFLYDEMGLGKTVQAVMAAAWWGYLRDCWPVLVIVPGALRTTWCEEIERWLPCLSPSDIQVLCTKKDTLSRSAKFVICGFRLVEHQLTSFLSRRFRMLIVDEAHRTRTFNSKQTISIMTLSHDIPHKLLLTGTPMLIRPFELFTQIESVLQGPDKDFLLPKWSCCSFDGDSHLKACLLNPLAQFDDFVKLFDINIADHVVDGIVKLGRQLPIDNAAWCRLDLQHRGVVLDTLKQFLSLLMESIKELFNANSEPSWLKHLKAAAYQKINPRFSHNTNYLQNQLTLMRRVANDSSRQVQQILHHTWNAHRFGMIYCEGKLKKFRRYNADGQFWLASQWEYHGFSRYMRRILSSTMQKHMVRRKKRHVLKDLPDKVRGTVLVHLNDAEGADNGNQSSDRPFSFTESLLSNNGAGDADESSLHTLASMTNIPRSQLCFELLKVGVAKATFVADYLIKLLETADTSQRFIVFAIHLRVLEIIKIKLDEKRGRDPSLPKYSSFGSEVITGSVPVEDRAEIVRRFQRDEVNGPRVLLLSVFAMGVGFTLTRCSTVIMAELYWSPEVLKQAEDRVHRVGQSQSVFVQYMCAPNSIDEKLWPILLTRMERIESSLKPHSEAKNEINLDFEMSQTSAIRQANRGGEKGAGRYAGVKAASTAVGNSTESYDFGLECSGDQLYFLVNTTTMRIHLYRKESSSRFIHLMENFTVGDFMYLAQCWVDQAKGAAPPSPALLALLPRRLWDPKSDAYRITQAFVREWTDLSRVEAKRVLELGRPVRVPLLLELSLRNSKRLTKSLVSFDRTCHPSKQMHIGASAKHGPNNYIVRRVLFTQTNGSKNVQCYEQAFLPDSGIPLCLYCASPYVTAHSCKNSNEEAVIRIQGSVKELFCGDDAPCYRSWHLKCYAGSARQQLREIDHGVCRVCKTDAAELCKSAKVHPAGSEQRLTAITCPDKGSAYCSHYVYRHGRRCRIHWSQLQVNSLTEQYLNKILRQVKVTEGLFWDADHVLAVCLGGGSASIENFQTLCKPCHKSKTKSDLHKRKLRRLAREQKDYDKVKGITPETPYGGCVVCGRVYASHVESVEHIQICPMRGIADKSQSSQKQLPETTRSELEAEETLLDGNISQDSVLAEVF